MRPMIAAITAGFKKGFDELGGFDRAGVLFDFLPLLVPMIFSKRNIQFHFGLYYIHINILDKLVVDYEACRSIASNVFM